MRTAAQNPRQPLCQCAFRNTFNIGHTHTVLNTVHQMHHHEFRLVLICKRQIKCFSISENGYRVELCESIQLTSPQRNCKFCCSMEWFEILLLTSMARPVQSLRKSNFVKLPKYSRFHFGHRIVDAAVSIPSQVIYRGACVETPMNSKEILFVQKLSSYRNFIAIDSESRRRHLLARITTI